MFPDRIEILSRGTIPLGQTSERTGRGVPKITEVYGKGTYEFRENSIVVSILFTRVSTEDENPR